MIRSTRPQEPDLTRRIAITGASGFIGRHLVEAARRLGWRPVVLMRRHPGDLLRPECDLDVVLGDLADRASLERLLAGADVIVHAAGAVKARNAELFFATNAMGTERLLGAAAAVNPKAAFIHVSSLAAREPTLSPYAASKLAGEDKVTRLAGDRPWTIVRPPAVYGPGDLELLPLFRLARFGLLPVPATEGARFSLIHVSDLADAVMALAQSNWREASVLEIDDGAEKGHDWPEIAMVLQRMVGRQVRPWQLPRLAMVPVAVAAQIIARVTGRPAILSRPKLNELYHRDWVSRRSEGPWSSTWHPRIGIWEGFASTWDWYRAEGFLS
jgi:nucleoside-diphosphate-sugar epimerase